MSFVEANGKQIFFESVGEGIPLIFIHPSLSNHRTWDFQRKLKSHFQLILIDLPGHGQSEMPNEEITISLYANYVIAAAKQLGLEKFIPIGLSLGGAISLQIALDFSHFLHAMVLVGTGAKMGVYPAILEGLKLDFQKGVNLVMGELAFSSSVNQKIIELSIRECLKCDPAIGYSDLAACNAFDVRERLSEINLPALIVAGSEDKLAPLKWSHYLAEKISNSMLRIIEGAGHMVPIEQPKQFNQALMDFLFSLDL